MATLWERLLSVALVGTERKPPPADALAQVAALLGDGTGTTAAGISRAPDRPDRRGAPATLHVAELVRDVGDTGDNEPAGGGGDGAGAGAGAATGAAGPGRGPDELAVLAAAGVVAAYRRVGLVVEHSAGALPAPAPVDERPEASPTAAQLLSLLLEGHVRVLGGPTELIEDWLGRCASGGKRPPGRLLPALLDHATRVLALRPAVIAAGGPRGGWLAGENPLWAWAAADAEAVPDHSDGEIWRTGEPGARMAVLAARRSTDPAGALALVEETWPGEKAKDRAQILEVLRTGLRLDDEAFLEACLDDRAPTVRAAAADLLAALPGSQLARRMAGRLRPLVAQRRPRRLEVALPDPPDAAARRDGIVDTGAPPATGRRTWWLIQLVGATPLAFWTDELGFSPADAVQQAQQQELVEGWVLAASRPGHADPAWARELLRVAPDPRLLRALPPEQARDLLPVALERATDPAVAGLLVATPAPWPPLLSQWVVHRLRANKNAVALDRSLTRLAAAGDAAIIPDLERWIDELRLHDRLRTTLRDVAHTLSIRRTIAQELS